MNVAYVRVNFKITSGNNHSFTFPKLSEAVKVVFGQATEGEVGESRK